MKKFIVLAMVLFLLASSVGVLGVADGCEGSCPSGSSCKCSKWCHDEGDYCCGGYECVRKSSGSSRSHSIEILDINDITVRQNHEEKVPVTILNDGDYDESDITVSVSTCPEKWTCSEAKIDALAKGANKTAELIMSLLADAKIMATTVYVNAYNGNTGDSNDFKAIVVAECISNIDCPAGKYCSQEKCVCEERWRCSEWGACANGQKARTCEEINNCGTAEQKPHLSESCQSSNPPKGSVTINGGNNNGGGNDGDGNGDNEGDDGEGDGNGDNGMGGITGGVTGGQGGNSGGFFGWLSGLFN